MVALLFTSIAVAQNLQGAAIDLGHSFAIEKM